ncbi:MAG: hypothetical protein WBX30_28040, partial [Stellaceae bacterium]
RDALLNELQVLTRGYPEAAAVRQRVAMALTNTVAAAEHERDLARRDALLDELRAMARSYPNDVRQQLAIALGNTLAYAKADGDLARHDALLDELRGLTRAYPEADAIRGILGRLKGT